MKKFLVSRDFDERAAFISGIEGKKIAIYHTESPLLEGFDEVIDMKRLMQDEYFLEKIMLCDSNTTLFLVDVLVKNGIYVHPYGKIFRFTELAKQTIIIDDFMFRYDEKNIVRPFLFIDTSVFGTSMLNFHAGEENTVENYAEDIRPFIDCRVDEIECVTINYQPTEEEIAGYEKLKRELVIEQQQTRSKVVHELIKYVDNLRSKQKAFLANSNQYGDAYVVTSNQPKLKFKIYDVLKKEKVGKIVFLSSGIFGADELQLKNTRDAILRHNKLIKILRNGEEIQQ